MGWRQERAISRVNGQMANTFSGRGRAEDMAGFVFPNGYPTNFVISGGVQPYDRYQPLGAVLNVFAGKCPIIVLHAGNAWVEQLAADAGAVQPDAGPVWLCSGQNPIFEPFLHMNDQQIIKVCRQLAAKLNYTVTPRFERVVKAHLRILQQLDIPACLTGLYYLCQFDDMGEFYDNVLALPCGEDTARRIWADLGTDDESGNSQFDLFRSIINNLAQDVQQSGWYADNTINQANILSAVLSNAVFSLTVSNVDSASLVLSYLAEELKLVGNRPFLLLIDGVKIGDESLFQYLSTAAGCCIGMVSDSIVDQVGKPEDVFLQFAERFGCFILLKHNTASIAETLSRVIGRFDYTRAEVARGFSRAFWGILPNDQHEDVRYTTENRYKIMPEDITGLGPGQAIIFDTTTDQIIRYTFYHQ